MWALWLLSSVALVVLLRSRWKRTKAWHRYAALSLWVHLLLACLATTIRIVTGAGGDESDAPIRVAVLQEAVVEDDVAEEDPPPLADWEQPTDGEVVAPELAVPPPITAEEIEQAIEEMLPETPAEPQPPEPEPTTETTQKSDNPGETDKVEAAPLPESAATPEAAPPADTLPPQAPDEDAVNPLRAKPSPPVPSRYADRFAADREHRAVRRGGSAQTERAVRQALAWLAATQSTTGGWVATRHGAGQERVVLGHNRGGAGANADMGVTGLALLAFLGAGSSHQSGPYAENVARGLEYLRQNQRADGSLFGDAQLFARTYCHSMASLAALEAYAITGDPSLRSMCTDAVGYSLSLQHPADGGWRYLPGQTGDTSQLGWQVMGLRTAHLAGIDVPSVTWTRMERFLRKVRRGQAGGLASYRPENGASRSMTAEALFCRQLLEGGPSAVHPEAVREAIDAICQQTPGSGQDNLYYWYYATLALESASGTSVHADQAWGQWNRDLTATLLHTQQSDGSWSEDTVWGGYGGRVYTTSLAALCLEVYYRYSPDSEPGEIARRPGWESVPR